LHYAQEEEMVRLGALNKVEGKVILQIDKNIPFDIMYKVMYTCGKVGYQIMNFAVMQREEE
jgi:biopolymer transport protein ExbD